MYENLLKYAIDIVNTYGSFEECAKDFNLSEEDIKSLMRNPVVLDSKMCNIIDTILKNK